MKVKRIDIWWNILFFIGGVLVCYAATEFKYLDIDKSFNVWETLLSIASIAVGLFIAVSLQKRYNKTQNLYGYLVNRLDVIWNEFNSFSGVIEASDKIEFTRVTKAITDMQRKNAEFRKLLTQLNLVDDDLENLSDELLHIFENCMQNQGIVYYDPRKDEILALNERITNHFVKIYADLNDKV